MRCGLAALRARSGVCLRVAINSVVNALPATLGVACMCLFVWVTLAIFAVDLLQGRMVMCSEPDVALEDCHAAANLTQVPSTYNFDHIGRALLTLFSISQLDRWSHETWRAMDAVEAADKPQVAIFFIVFMLFGSILDRPLLRRPCQRVPKEPLRAATHEQLQWIEAKKVAEDLKAKAEAKRQRRQQSSSGRSANHRKRWHVRCGVRGEIRGRLTKHASG